MECVTFRCGEPQLAFLVVTHLMDGNNGKEHVVVIDNYLSNV